MPASNTMLHRGVCGLLIPGLRQQAPHVTHFILPVCISVQLNKADHVMPGQPQYPRRQAQGAVAPLAIGLFLRALFAALRTVLPHHCQPS
eukprot:COSAG02_NODE_5984_length_3890_cov_11.855447_3_plen_90_part_00